MSLCRWGHKCYEGYPLTVEDRKCAANGCPGSSLYIYEIKDNSYVCCVCPIEKTDYILNSESELYNHLIEHEKRRHHFPRNLLKKATEFLEKKEPCQSQ